MTRSLRSLLAALCVICGCAFSGLKAAENPAPPRFPQCVLANDKLNMLMYLPDAEKGFYRGTRFDWSGMIARIRCGGHVFYAPWKTTHDPGNHDDVIGPAEEFGITKALGWDEARSGETFIKIGIGHLRKGNDARYSFATRYEIAKAAPWKIDQHETWILFEQKLEDDRGWGYEFSKRVSLLDKEPGFLIERRLKNTGTKPIETEHYNHNFTMIDDELIGPSYQLIYPFELTAPTKPQGFEGVAALRGKELVFTAAMPADRSLYTSLQGFKVPEDHRLTIRNIKTGAAIHISGDHPLSRAAFYATNMAVCPEPFVRVSLKSGEEMTWSTRYVLDVGQPDRK